MFSPEELQEVQLFLGLLYPWDKDTDLYKTVTWTFTARDGQTAFANYAAQDLPSLVKLIETRSKRAGANVYVALSTQRLADTTVLSTDGFAKAIRKHENLVSFKSMALDIDVGKKDAYATTDDAFAALDDFRQKVGLPIPTMEVYSGSGGLHVYWCFNEQVPKAQWMPLAKALRDAALAYGLKFDPQVTVNPAGILRVPNTWNHKKVPPAKVRLYRNDGHTFPRYGYQQLLGMLGAYTETASLRTPQGPGVNARSKNFQEGVSESSPPVPIDDVAANCAALDDILSRGGAGDSEPLWNLALYAAAFTSDPYNAAHRLGNGHAGYSKDSTEKKLVEKINARASNSAAGWPTCDSFSALHPACAGCPLFAQKKTPFHHARRPAPIGQAKYQPQDFMPAAGDDPLMPHGYWRGKNNNYVFTTLTNKSGMSYTAEVINYPIIDAVLDNTDGALIYRAIIGGVERWRSIDVSANMQPAQTASALAKNHGLYINPKNHQAARDFLVAWVTHLQTLKRTAAASTSGWTRDGSFVFDDKIYGPTGTDIVHRGKHADPNFVVSGELKPWQDAMALVYGNMPLETVVASAFAAPLVELIGSYSLVLSIFSAASGVGKSTAMMLAQAVWGNPRTGMSTLADTTNSMMKKISDLKSLPVYWDELRTKDQLEKVIDIVFQVTQGKGKAKLTRDSQQMEASSFTTMFVVASNSGIGDTVYSQTESTEAGGLRLFEINAIKLTTTMNHYQAGQLVVPLQTNYGAAGAAFAEWIARNKPQVLATLKSIDERFHQRLQFTAKERFWRMTIDTLLGGAVLANHSGLAKFDLAGLADYLEAMLKHQRSGLKMQEYATMAATKDVVGLLQEMASDVRAKNLIITENIPYVVMGKPRPVNLVDTDLSHLGDIWLQVGDRDGRIRARVRPFNEWLRKRNLNPGTIIEALKGSYHVAQSKQTVGSGVAGLDASTRIGRAECYDFTPLIAHAPSPGSDEQS